MPTEAFQWLFYSRAVEAQIAPSSIGTGSEFDGSKETFPGGNLKLVPGFLELNVSDGER